jgi:hypothetical protein
MHALTLGVNQGLMVGTDIGASVGASTSPLGSSKWLGLRGAQWWLYETLQTTIEIRKVQATQKEAEIYGADTRQVILPEELEGENVNVGVRHLTTPSTILLSTYSFTKRSDRPDAHAFTIEGRQFLAFLNGAVHANVAHYENVGEIRPITLYGSVVANSIKVEWHQKLLGNSILMAGYRYYSEEENPRETNLNNTILSSDWIYANFRYRFAPKNAWLTDAPEIYTFAGRYANNQPNEGFLIGVGGKITL